MMPPRRPVIPPKINAEWCPGPRTPAWELLWQRIFADVLNNQKDSPDDIMKEIKNDR